LVLSPVIITGYQKFCNRFFKVQVATKHLQVLQNQHHAFGVLRFANRTEASFQIFDEGLRFENFAGFIVEASKYSVASLDLPSQNFLSTASLLNLGIALVAALALITAGSLLFIDKPLAVHEVNELATLIQIGINCVAICLASA